MVFDTATPSDGIIKILAKTAGTNPAATKGFTMGDNDTGVEVLILPPFRELGVCR